ncbi:DNA translocase FtsK [Sphingomonas sp. YL-JM2C]
MSADRDSGKGSVRVSYSVAVDDVLASGRTSKAMLERRLGISFDAASRLIERMQADGIVSAPDQLGRRELLPDAAAIRGALPDDPDETMEDERPGVDGLGGLASVSFGGELEAARDRDIAVSVERMLAKVERQRGRFDDESREAVRQIAERALRLMAQRDAINGDLRMLFGFAKEVGFDPRGLRAAITDLRLDQDVRKEREAQHAAYRAVLGVDGPEIDIVIEKPAAPVPAAAKKISAREKTFRDSMALIAASRIADAS